MRAVIFKVAAPAVVGAVAYVALIAGAETPSVPTAEFIAASLQDQEVACGKSLEVNYEYREERDAQPCNVRYVRTPDISFIEFSLPGGNLVTKASYDRGRREFQQYTSTAGGTKTGAIKNQIDAPLSSRLVMDTTRYNINGGTIGEVIRHGTVFETTEMIDGHACLRVDVAPSDDRGACSVWVDPQIGFCPRKVEIPRENRKSQVIEFSDYKEIANGVWFPGTIDNRFTIPDKGEMHYISRVKETSVDKPFLQEELTVTFPSGTEVIDSVLDAKYTVP